MSTILKALKKLEEEKRAAQAPADLPRKILTNAAETRRKSSPVLWVGVGISIGLLLTMAVAAGFFWQGKVSTDLLSPGRTQPVAKLSEQPLAGSKIASAPPGEALLPSPAMQKETPTASTGPAPVAARRPEPLLTSPPRRMAAAKDAVEPQASRATSVEQVQVERREIPAPGQQWAAPHLKVGDILPASGGGRMAIVNGLPVMEGTMVEDAVVREIRAGQVVFEVEGKSIVVPLERRP